MRVELAKIPLHNVDGKMMGQCPECKADHPSLTVVRNNGHLAASCYLCSFTASEPFRATKLDDVIMDADALQEIDIPHKKSLIAPWLSEQTITLVAGWRGVGKSWFALGLCEAITRGEDFGPWETRGQAPCLFIDGEMVPQDLQERLACLTNGTPRKAQLSIYNDCHSNALGLPRASLLNRRWRQAVKDYCIDRGIKLIVLDNISSLAPGVDENAKRDWDPINQWLLDLRFAGIATVMLHHTNKGGGQRGTSAREDNIDSSIVLHHPYDYNPEEGARFTLKFKKARVRNEDLSKIADIEFQLTEVDGHLTWIYAPVKKKNQIEVLRMIDEGVQQKDIAEALHIDKGYVSRIKTQAMKDNLLTDKGKLTQTGFELVNELVTEEVN